MDTLCRKNRLKWIPFVANWIPFVANWIPFVANAGFDLGLFGLRTS